MKKNLLKSLIITICLFVCTACFDLQENLYLKKDGAGNFSFVINMSEFKSMMDMFGDGGSNSQFGSDKTSTEKLNSAFQITRKKLLNTNGITNVNAIEDTINYTFGIGFDFKNIDALNKAMNKLFDDDSATNTKRKEITYFTWKDNKLTRIESLDTKSILGKTTTMAGKDKLENNFFNIEKLFEGISYSCIYKFDDKIVSSNNSNAILSTDSKSINLKCYPFASITDSTQKKCNIANTIIFK